jgi:hypothetical protein
MPARSAAGRSKRTPPGAALIMAIPQPQSGAIGRAPLGFALLLAALAVRPLLSRGQCRLLLIAVLFSAVRIRPSRR